MYDNNLNQENKPKDLIAESKSTSIILKDLTVDFEEQLYSINMFLKNQLALLQEKERELSEIERTRSHSLDLFSPIYSKACDTTELVTLIEQIEKKIDQLKQEQQALTNKITGLKSAAQIIDSSIKYNESNEEEKDYDNKQKLADKGLGSLEAQEIERQRIARDLHDSTVQNLTSLVHKSELCIKLIDIDVIRAKLELNSMSSTLKMVINDMRGIIYNLKPMTLDDLGLTITIQRYANRVTNLNNILVKVTANEETTEILSVIKLTLFRIIQEACNNIIKHAKANLINIDINYEEHKINVVVKDNGIGFNMDNLNTEQSSSFGLSIMKERISLLSGSLDIKSEKEIGTTITITVPLTIYEGGEK